MTNEHLFTARVWQRDAFAQWQYAGSIGVKLEVLQNQAEMYGFARSVIADIGTSTPEILVVQDDERIAYTYNERF